MCQDASLMDPFDPLSILCPQLHCQGCFHPISSIPSYQILFYSSFRRYPPYIVLLP
ncbi:hypothetical protein Lalb_Chr02g0149621 [Lupinus albus]|uniref:Uncharacterized protein n=1 Tax=Lupinus albus TaxID=3870 RepID=A0A6A4R0F4_LUPAL|nr:hypothetical protein Lalb_Chr02g0149621 [Lupinus albus]